MVFVLEEGSSRRIFENSEAGDWNHWCCGLVQKCHLKQKCCRGWTVLQMKHEVNVREGGKVSLWTFLWSEASRCSPMGLICARAWEQLRADGRGHQQEKAVLLKLVYFSGIFPCQQQNNPTNILFQCIY